MTFGEKLILYRKTHNKMTQETLAKIVGTTKQVISRYEKGERTPKIDTVQEYAHKLNLPVLYLVDNDISVIPASDTTILSSHESEVITSYRDKPLVQPHVDKLLDIQPEQEKAPSEGGATIPLAAYDGSDDKPAITSQEKLDAAPDLKL